MGGHISSTNPQSQSIGLHNENKVDVDSVGTTPDNRQVTAVAANRQISDVGTNEKTGTSLAERTVQSLDIATAADFQPIINEMKHLESIQQQIKEIPAFNSHGIQNGASKQNIADKAVASVFSALQSIKHVSGEKLIAYGAYSLPSKNMTLAEGKTPYGARFHLENAFSNIKEMQSLNNKLDEFSSVDIALSMSSQQNRAILRPHIELVFADLENKPKPS